MNKVYLLGKVLETPELIMDSKKGDAVKIRLGIDRPDIKKEERLTIMVVSEEFIDIALNSVEIGDEIMVTNARIVTRAYKKFLEYECPNCFNVDYKEINAKETVVEVYEFYKLKPQDGVVNDIEIRNGFNKVVLLGQLNKDCNYRPKSGPNDGDYLKFSVVVQSTKSKGDDGKYKYDYDIPYIVCFRQLASNVYRSISDEIVKKDKSICIGVEGSIQEREITQKKNIVCSCCSNKFVSLKNSIVKEIIATHAYLFRNKVPTDVIGNESCEEEKD